MAVLRRPVGRVLGKGKGLKKSRLHVSKYQGVGLGGVASCMNPARRAIKGFIWSVRLSEAEPSKNRRFLALNSLRRTERVMTVGGFVGE